jgi:cytochrome c biogenesis protein CcdA
MMKGASKVYVYRYLMLSGAVLLLALAGYSTYALYPRFALTTTAGSGLPLLATAAGLASLFSPCSFPLLVTLLARETDGQSRGTLYRSATAFTVGVMFFLLLLGAAIGLGAGALITRFTFSSPAGRGLRLLVGLSLISFGFWQLRGRSLNVAWLNRALQPLWDRQFRLRQRKTTLSYGLYGFGYVLAGFG